MCAVVNHSMSPPRHPLTVAEVMGETNAPPGASSPLSPQAEAAFWRLDAERRAREGRALGDA